MYYECGHIYIYIHLRVFTGNSLVCVCVYKQIIFRCTCITYALRYIYICIYTCTYSARD